MTLNQAVMLLQTVEAGPHRTRQAAERLAAGELWQEHGLVFCREDGTPLDPWPVRQESQKITMAARLGGEWRTSAT